MSFASMRDINCWTISHGTPCICSCEIGAVYNCLNFRHSSFTYLLTYLLAGLTTNYASVKTIGDEYQNDVTTM